MPKAGESALALNSRVKAIHLIHMRIEIFQIAVDRSQMRVDPPEACEWQRRFPIRRCCFCRFPKQMPSEDGKQNETQCRLTVESHSSFWFTPPRWIRLPVAPAPS